MHKNLLKFISKNLKKLSILSIIPSINSPEQSPSGTRAVASIQENPVARENPAAEENHATQQNTATIEVTARRVQKIDVANVEIASRISSHPVETTPTIGTQEQEAIQDIFDITSSILPISPTARAIRNVIDQNDDTTFLRT